MVREVFALAGVDLYELTARSSVEFGFLRWKTKKDAEQLGKGVAITATVTALGMAAVSGQKNSSFGLDAFNTDIAVEADIHQIGESPVLTGDLNLKELTTLDREVEALEVTGTETVNADAGVEALEVTGTETVNADAEVEALEVTGTETVNADAEVEASEVTGTEIVKADTDILNDTGSETDIRTASAGTQEVVEAEEDLAMTAREERDNEQLLQSKKQVAEVQEALIAEEQIAEGQSTERSVEEAEVVEETTMTNNVSSDSDFIKTTIVEKGVTITYYEVSEDFILSHPVKTGDIVLTEEEFINFCKVLEAEAGNQGITGKVKVGNVIVNRMRRDKASLNSVIFAPKQFASIANVNSISNETIEAARMALEADYTIAAMQAIAQMEGLSPEEYSEGAYFFYNPEGCEYDALNTRKDIKVAARFKGHVFSTKYR